MIETDSGSCITGLLEQYRLGDHFVENLIFERCQSQLFFIAKSMLHRFPKARIRIEATDLLQQGQIRLLKALRKIPLNCTPDFLRLAARHIRWELLSMIRTPLIPITNDGSHSELHDSDFETEDPAMLATWREVHDRIAQLPEGERQLFDLLYYHGLSQVDAAKYLDWPLRTLTRRWLEAKSQFMKQYENKNPF